MTVNYLVTRKLRIFFKLIYFIQKRFLCRYVSREAKLEILVNQWNKFRGQLFTRNLSVKHEPTRKLIDESC